MTRLFIIKDGSVMPDIPCGEVSVKSYPTNAGLIWFGIDSTAIENRGYPLDVGLEKIVKIWNMNQLSFFFENSTDTVALLCEIL